MRVEVFDFALPQTHIALRPASPRDSAKLLCVGANGNLTDKSIRNLPALLNTGDALIVNDTRVMPVRLVGTRHRKGQTAQIELTLIERLDATLWRALLKPAKRVQKGDVIMFDNARAPIIAQVIAQVIDRQAGEAQLQFDLPPADMDKVLTQIGSMPLPPYIATRRPPDMQDKSDYQTLFATRDGAIAAPTAGLHFTPNLLDALKAKGIAIHQVTLHVGIGTFLPVKVDDTDAHTMHSEWGEITEHTAQALNACKEKGGRLIAVGSTPLRLLETAANKAGKIEAFCGHTDIFITPGYRFKACDRLLTNFHLPKSTLFMLVCAFAGIETMQTAYAHAIAQNYRFYSYGDACLLDRQQE